MDGHTVPHSGASTDGPSYRMAAGASWRRRSAGDVSLPEGCACSLSERFGVEELFERDCAERGVVCEELGIAAAHVGVVRVAGGVDDQVAAPPPAAAFVLQHREEQQVLERCEEQVGPVGGVDRSAAKMPDRRA